MCGRWGWGLSGCVPHKTAGRGPDGGLPSALGEAAGRLGLQRV